jgi:hypothetical protein
VQATPAPPSASPAASGQALWKRVLPFVLGFGLIGLTLSRVDMKAFAHALAGVNAPAFIAFAVAWILALLTADAFASTRVYQHIDVPIRFREFWVLRGAAYLPSIVNHHVGQAILTYYVSRRYQVSLARMAGGTLLVYASHMGCLLLAGAAAMVFAGWPLVRPALALGAGVVYLIIIAARPAFLARTKLLAPLFEAGLAGHVVALLTRIPHFLVLFAGTLGPLLFFGVNVPFGAALIYVPIMMVVATLPLTPQGVGTRGLLGVTFFAQYAPGATLAEQGGAIMAATTSWEVSFTVVEALLGLFLLRRAMPALDSKEPGVP